MDKIQRFKKVLKCVRLINSHGATASFRSYCTGKDTIDIPVMEEPLSSETQMKLTGFAKSYEKFSIINELLKSTTAEKPPTFPSLLRNSALMDLGDPEGKYVHGNIVDIVGDDLYIDFGWKFNCICPRPKVDPTLYVRGAKVLLLVKSLELSSKFLGAKKDLTILEADCILVSLLSSPLFHFEKKL